MTVEGTRGVSDDAFDAMLTVMMASDDNEMNDALLGGWDAASTAALQTS